MSKNIDSTNITTTQIGTIAENLVMNQIIIHSTGRLSPFIPIADDDGIDLVIYDKITGFAIPIQVKSRTNTLYKRGTKERGNLVAFSVRKKKLNTERDMMLLCVLLSKNLLSIEVTWKFKIKKNGKDAKKNGFSITANKQEKTKDKYKKNQYQNFNDVVNKLVSEFDLKQHEHKHL